MSIVKKKPSKPTKDKAFGEIHKFPESFKHKKAGRTDFVLKVERPEAWPAPPPEKRKE